MFGIVPPGKLLVPRALIVEDNQVLLRIAVLNLRRLSISSDTARNGQEALELVACNSYDLILMDISMPVMDGLEATRRIREMQQESGIRCPIIAVTASESRAACIDAGMDDYITKPADYDRVVLKWLPKPS